jgi:preprotein translocase subunit SecF
MRFVKNRFKFYAFSGIFIIAGLISMFTQGFNYGVDFGVAVLHYALPKQKCY